jgi:gamma-aminobutyric acid type B receptor
MYTSESYPNFFRVVPSESAFNAARLAFVRKYNWTRVGTIYQNNGRYSLPHTRLLTDLDTAEVEITNTQSISDEIGVDLQKFKEKDVRIIIGFFDGMWAQRIFCQAYQMGLYGRKYQWILGSFDKTWWKVHNDSLLPGNCTGIHVQDAADGLISIDVLPLSSSNEITVSGMTAAEYESMYNKARRKEYSKYHGYAYDGVWTIAHVIHSVTNKLRAQNSDLTFRNFRYKDPFWAQFLRQALNETLFAGVTGNVSFDGNERRGSILLKQLQSGREVQIAEYHSTRDILMLRPGVEIYWRGNR